MGACLLLKKPEGSADRAVSKMGAFIKFEEPRAGPVMVYGLL